MIGHVRQWKLLKGTALTDKIPHALLFKGPEQIGKRTLAIELIKFINCEAKERPCNVCKNCVAIEKGSFPDFIFLGSKEIQISEIRELIRKLSFKPYSAPFKSAVIDSAHLMNIEAQNCFLKTLEEPDSSFIILITDKPDMLLPTILSRVQKINFFPVGDNEIRDYLREKVALNKIDYFLELASGKPGIAVDFLNDPKKVEDREKIISDLSKLCNSDICQRFKYVKEAKEDDIKGILEIWLSCFRKTLLSNKGEYSRIKKTIELIQSTIDLITKTNTNPKLAMEIVLMEI